MKWVNLGNLFPPSRLDKFDLKSENFHEPHQYLKILDKKMPVVLSKKSRRINRRLLFDSFIKELGPKIYSHLVVCDEVLTNLNEYATKYHQSDKLRKIRIISRVTNIAYALTIVAAFAISEQPLPDVFTKTKKNSKKRNRSLKEAYKKLNQINRPTGGLIATKFQASSLAIRFTKDVIQFDKHIQRDWNRKTNLGEISKEQAVKFLEDLIDRLHDIGARKDKMRLQMVEAIDHTLRLYLPDRRIVPEIESYKKDKKKKLGVLKVSKTEGANSKKNAIETPDTTDILDYLQALIVDLEVTFDIAESYVKIRKTSRDQRNRFAIYTFPPKDP